MKLNPKQAKQIEMQLENHRHDSYRVDIELSPGHVLHDLSVHKGVFRPDITASVYLTRWLFYNNGMYSDLPIIDVGCGTGIQGIVTAIQGASRVTLTDISQTANENASENIKTYKLEDRVKVVKGDLFENVENESKLIIFNHPFFPEDPYKEITVSKSMLGGEDLIHRFFEASTDYLRDDGSIVMSYFHLAGDTNNPSVQGPKHGFKVYERFKVDVCKGLQKGPFSIYELIKER